MFATCLFCHGPLGRNEVLEHFPVGRRIAYDGERGRLWVVCPRCERWNLSPLEERWEALEEAERAYRGTTRRVATDNVALAKLPEGLELVRIGQPLRPEFAAWRYGDQYGRRLRRAVGYGAVGAAALAGVAFAGPAVGIAVGSMSSFMYMPSLVWQYMIPTARVPTAEGTWLRPTRQQLFGAKWLVGSDGTSSIELTSRHWRPAGGVLRRVGVRSVPTGRNEKVSLSGEPAQRALAHLLPALNSGGAFRGRVDEAVRFVEDVGGSERVLEAAARAPRRSKLAIMGATGDSFGQDTLAALTTPTRLALEMALHEEDERRALTGELGALYARWEEAERIAAIADKLLLPESTDD